MEFLNKIEGAEELKDLMRQLDSLPLSVKTAGQQADAAKRNKVEMIKRQSEAKNTFEMARASVVMSMPDILKNETQRNAYITQQCAREIADVAAAEMDVISAESIVVEAQREHYFYQDQLTSTQKKADVVSSALKYLSSR